VEILPAGRGQAVARTDGEIVEVLITEGGQVAAGDVVARLSAWDQESSVAIKEAQLEGAEASLARLLAGAKPEEIELARRQVRAAEQDVVYFQAEADRARELVRSGTMSAASAEKAESDLAARLADLEVARANLDLVESPATAEEIAIARAEVEKLRRELAFARDELERTRIVAPVDGRVVTPNLNLRIGSFLRSGDVLLEIERTDVVDAEIAVPESDIPLVAVGDTVRLKAWGHADDEILGRVETIAPAASDQGYGSVVRVGARFANPDDFLRTGMTGYAKIDGVEMRVWEAYLRSIRRFFQIEVWSWIP
jgi:multidrug resistance efflux pump